MDPETIASVFSAREEYLSAAFDTIDRQFGGVDAYVEQHLGLDDETREALYAVCLT
jgi:protein-tyrosine phosphatase